LGNVTASLGVAVYPTAGESPAELIATADRMLYRAKKAGRNRVEVFGDFTPAEPEIVAVAAG